MLAENVESYLTMIGKSIIYKVLCSVNRRIATASEWFRKSCSRVILWLIGDGLILTVAGLFILCGVLFYWCRWTWFSDWGAEGWRNLIFLVAAAGGFVALYFNWQRIKGDRMRLENETYVKALELFGSEDESIRIGAIYALERIALESMNRYHLPIMDVLCAYVRKQSSTDEKESGSVEQEIQEIEQEIQEILTVIGRRSEEQRKIEGIGPRIDLRDTYLPSAYLCGANLDSTFLFGANLNYAALAYCSLKGTSLQMSNLKEADLEGANLEDADLNFADLEDTNLKNVRGLTQDMLDQAKHEESAEPPNLDGAKCTSTGKQLVWRFPSADKVGK